MSVVNAIPLLAAGDDGYSISRSLRLRSSASAYLNRTPATTGNRQKFTVSMWLKLGSTGAGTVRGALFGGGNCAPGGSTGLGVHIQGTSEGSRIQAFAGGGTTMLLVSSNKYRDPSSWYHMVFSVDTTQSTAANRFRMYVNNQEITSFDSNTQVAQNTSFDWNLSGTGTYLGAYNDGTPISTYFDGYITEINAIDGQQLTPSSFGEFSLYNQWLPKKYAGTYGTNGFYLNFADNSAATAAAIGKDSSGNGNNWTPNNISVTTGSSYDSMTDVPTLTSATAANFAVLSPIGGVPSPIAGYTTSTITNGNLTAAYGGGTIAGCVSTIPINVSGSWYWEATLTAVTSDLMITPSGYQTSSRLGLEISLFLGRIVSDGSTVQSGLATGSNGDVIGIAYDSSTRTATITKNNAAWATQAVSTTANAYFLYAGVEDYSSVLRHNASFNFGQRPFAYTPPTGYLALNTFNL